jgi:hypothetical protein
MLKFNFTNILYPLSNFPQGGKVSTPSPMGEGWEGGMQKKELLILSFHFKVFARSSYFLAISGSDFL